LSAAVFRPVPERWPRRDFLIGKTTAFARILFMALAGRA
jgi:hypothetical protein